MYKIKLTDEQCAALEEAEQHFASWRATETGRERIPEMLWRNASDLFHTWELSINRRNRACAHTASDCVIEMEKQSGVKMRMCFRGRADPAVGYFLPFQSPLRLSYSPTRLSRLFASSTASAHGRPRTWKGTSITFSSRFMCCQRLKL